MVWLRDKDIVDFPNFEGYLQTFQQIQDNKKVWDAFLKWSYLPADLAVQSVSYATYPIVNVKKSIFDNAYDYGHFSPERPDDIWVRRDSVQTYENSEDTTEVYQTERYLESLILHEMIHWGRYHMSSLDKEEKDGTDSGDKFQAEAYSNPYKPHLP